MKYNIYQNKNGFFIIESLVIITIILILILAVFMIISGQQIKERDQQRINDLNIVRNALLAYYDDYGYYPASRSSQELINSNPDLDIGMAASDYNNLASLLSLFIDELPTDPFNPANRAEVNDFYLYRYSSSDDGQNFVILFETENLADDSPMAVVDK